MPAIKCCAWLRRMALVPILRPKIVSLANATVPNFSNGADTLHLMSYILDVRAVQQQLSHITGQIRQLSGVQHIIASDIDHTDAVNGLTYYLVS